MISCTLSEAIQTAGEVDSNREARQCRNGLNLSFFQTSLITPAAYNQLNILGGYNGN